MDDDSVRFMSKAVNETMVGTKKLIGLSMLKGQMRVGKNKVLGCFNDLVVGMWLDVVITSSGEDDHMRFVVNTSSNNH